MHLPTRILVPVTFDATGRTALRAAVELAALAGAELRLVHIWVTPYAADGLDPTTMPFVDSTLFDRARRECAAELQRFASSCGVNMNAPHVRWSIHSGDPATEILAEVARQACDWVLMGTHQRHGFSHWLNGSVAEGVLRHATCPVLIVPNAAEGTAVEASGEPVLSAP